MTYEETKRDIEAYKELDEKLKEVVENFWRKYPNTDASFSGSVLFGSWRVMRSSDFDGLTFKLNHEQMADLVNNNECIVHEKELIHQNELKLEKNK